MTSTKKRITAALTAAILTTTLAIPAMATEAPDEPVRVSSYKGSTLEVGDRIGRPDLGVDDTIQRPAQFLYGSKASKAVFAIGETEDILFPVSPVH